MTICKGQGLFLRADDAGLVVRNFYGRTRRIAWTEISRFADGSYTSEGVTGWQLCIVLRTGKRVRVTSSVLAPAGEVVAAVRDAAQPHGIPADRSGIAAKTEPARLARPLPGSGRPARPAVLGWQAMVAAPAAGRRRVEIQRCPEGPRFMVDAADGRRALDVCRGPR